MNVEEKLVGLGLKLPEAAKPVAAYVPAVRTGNLVYTAGQVPFRNGELAYRGTVGGDVTQDEAYDAARISALNALAAIKDVVGDLDSVVRVVRVCVYVSSAHGFHGQPQVANGASELLQDIFGDRGKHARSAVGVADLPLGAPVEVELLVEVAG